MSGSLRRKALLIGTETYADGRFGALPSTRADLWQMRQVVEHRSIGAFASVRVVADPTADDMRFEIAEFLEGCEQNELALLYITGHGTRLAQSTGEFFFVAADTDFDRIAETGVGAGFVNERLEECWAPQKVAVLDCCRSGGFALGWRTGDGKPQAAAKSAEPAPLSSRGVYVIASSRAGEDSYSGADTSAGPEPSAFTAQLVEALRTGKAGRDSAGQVSVDDLFDYVNRRMRGLDRRQIPVKSALAVDDRIILAGCPQGAAPVLAPLIRRTAEPASVPPGVSGAAPPSKGSAAAPTWPRLLDYYRRCVISDEVETPLLTVADHGGSYVCLTGPERFLSGDVDDDGCTPLTPEVAELLDSPAGKAQDTELWAGYPAVVLTGSPTGRSPRSPRFAPLLMRRVEVVFEGEAARLRPYGPVVPHPRLARDRLGPEEAAELALTYQPTWHTGQHDRMAVDLRNLLLNDFELPCVQELRPDRLAGPIDVRTPAHGARNAAVLFLMPRDTVRTRKLLEDFASIAGKLSQIPRTALAALSPEADAVPREPGESTETIRLVTPLPANEAQLAVLRSALTRRLTVATGPPGTGKSQLVANLVATAVANGRSVLVASTNNQAVDEVWRRCERLVPGTVVRTGSRGGETDYRQQEAATLQRLLTTPPPVRTLLGAQAEVDLAGQGLDALRTELAEVAHTERRLRQAGEDRDGHARELGVAAPALAEALGADERLPRWERRAARAARARFLGRWRRTRLLRGLGLAVGSDDAEACAAVARFADAERRWRRGRERIRTARGDTPLAEALGEAEASVQASAATLLESTVRAGATAGRQGISGLLQAADGPRSDWPAVRAVLAHVRGWAVTSLSARRFPPDPALFDLVIIDEASQCAIPHVVPLLFRARHALVIGDVMQLPHIARIGPEHEAAIRRDNGLRADWLEKQRLAYRRHSAFHAAERAAGGSMLLDEHYRCHPDIIEVSNDLFYGGRLAVLTDIRSRPAVARPAVTWAPVTGKAMRPRSGGSWLNPAEIEKVGECVDYLVRHLPAEATIGVVTPFKPQQEALRERLSHEKRVRVGTVHTFQGGECDAMVFSLVAAEGMHSGAISWVDRQLNLWNVAVTRARSHLVVVGDPELWRERGGVGAALLRAAGAAGAAEGAGGDEGDDLLLRLYREFRAVPGVSVELGGTVHGHRVDAVLESGGRVTAVLLDRGPGEGADHARHLRLMLRRRELLVSPDGRGSATRLPAWRLYDADAVREVLG
ncbi:AAA domain-containing protein [Streptosporangium sp. NPDC051022]|uniref:caspase, EACC1-associated type n=1 Tax=Streptosporangium sp. NPDC051022 TaxID=3155752 RepID=UPI00342E68DD